MSTLMITDYNGRLSLENDEIVMLSEVPNTKISLGTIDSIFLFSNAQMTTQLVKKLMRLKISVHLFSHHGRYIGQIQSGFENQYDKQLKQILAITNDNYSLKLAKIITSAKIQNQISLLKNWDEQAILTEKDYQIMQEALSNLNHASNIIEVMGYEGAAASIYFTNLSYLVPNEFRFQKRTKNPPRDPVNALISFGYSIIYAHMIGQLNAAGLNPGVAVMHRNKRRHATLASDLMEEWRAIIVDDLVMELLDHNKITIDMFETDFDDENQTTIQLTKEGKQIFFEELDARMNMSNQYLPNDNHRYGFLYAVQKQIEKLIKSFYEVDPEIYTPVSEWEDE